MPGTFGYNPDLSVGPSRGTESRGPPCLCWAGAQRLEEVGEAGSVSQKRRQKSLVSWFESLVLEAAGRGSQSDKVGRGSDPPTDGRGQ